MYTKGPWDMAIMKNDFIPKAQGGGEKITVWAGKGNERKRVCTATKYDKLSETKANAHLIAAAPELLEACKEANKFAKEVFRTQEEGLERGRKVERLLEQAIAKAEGK